MPPASSYRVEFQRDISVQNKDIPFQRSRQGRAERHRAAAVERKVKQHWARGVRQFHEQALGAFTVEIVRPAQLLTTRPELAVPLTFGWYAQACALPVAPLCLNCDNELRPPTAPRAWLVVSGAVAATGQGLIVGVCKACAARDDAELLRIGLAYLRRLWPDLRENLRASLHPAGGRV